MTFQELESMYYGLNIADWHQHNNGGAWVHKNAIVSDKVMVGDKVVVWGGTIKGGTIKGGTIWGGTIWGGTIWGGTIWGGTWKITPLFISDSRGHGCSNAKPGYLYIGCEHHTYEEWKKEFKAIALKHNLTPDEVTEYKEIVNLFCKIGK